MGDEEANEADDTPHPLPPLEAPACRLGSEWMTAGSDDDEEQAPGPHHNEEQPQDPTMTTQ